MRRVFVRCLKRVEIQCQRSEKARGVYTGEDILFKSSIGRILCTRDENL